jgi:hypothetical protein
VEPQPPVCRIELCEALEALACRLGRSPTVIEVLHDRATPDPGIYRVAFGSLEAAYEEAGLPPPTGAREGPRLVARSCLRCDRPFPSQGAHNRLCNGCRAINAETLDPPAALVPGVRLGDV